MDNTQARTLIGSEIHGFHTLADLDVANMMEEARTRWLRPNEIQAVLCNHKCFTIHVKPVHLPKSGTVVLFDRKMLRNFRKDGHNWKKKNDGKTVKEAHEHLKVGNEERIHVYYAHGQDNPTFVRRCYWLLDNKKFDPYIARGSNKVQLQGLPGTPMNSNSSSVSDHATPLLVLEEFDSGVNLERADSLSVRNHVKRLHDINTLEWDELLVTNNAVSSEALEDNISVLNQQNHASVNGSLSHVNAPIACNLSAEATSFTNSSGVPAQSTDSCEGVYNQTDNGHVNSIREGFSATMNGEFLNILVDEELPNQDNFGRWTNSIMIESPGSVDYQGHESSTSSSHDPFASATADREPCRVSEHIFNIIDFSPAWTYSNENTKILVSGFFDEDYRHLAKSNMFCVCGDIPVPAVVVQPGVYRCFVSQQSPGLVNLYMSLDGIKPISQVLNFEYCASSSLKSAVPPEDQSKWEKVQLQMRLSYLLFSSSKSLHILSGKVSPHALNEAKKFAGKTANISNSWAYLIKSIESGRARLSEAENSLLELTFRIRLKEWLLERILEGSKTARCDSHGQGVIHLCTILGYTWAIHLFSWSGLSLDYRDKYGWTALHWAAYLGNEKMVAVLLSAGAKPNLVTDPTSQDPGGRTASDLASMKGYAGLAAYLSEKALVSQFEDMVIAGNATGSLQTDAVDSINPGNPNEDLSMKASLAAYRTAAEAAAHIQAAFREHSLKVRTQSVLSCNPEDEARLIVAAMKIQHAFHRHETKKKMAAAARIQYRFRTWKMRREFVNMRNQALKIQTVFRGFQVRRQYRKILWSVGVLEKAVLRWRLKRKGFRGLHVNSAEVVEDQNNCSDSVEEFYKISQKQAVERVERAVVTVQAMFRSKKAREEYQRMKLAHSEATLEYECFDNDKPDSEMDT